MIRVGIIGIRGFNVVYSGFETFVTKLVTKSNKRRLFFYLYVRESYQTQTDNKPISNLLLMNLPTIKGKYLDPFFYSIIATFASLSKKTEVILYLGLPNTLLIGIQKLFGRRVIVNVDGLDWQRKRWSIFGKTYLRLCELLTVLFSDVIITDSQAIFFYYKNKYKVKKIIHIPYGAEVKIRKPGKTLVTFGIEAKKYIITVGRFTPENSIEDLLVAFKKIKTDFRCVIVGDSVYEDNYKKYLFNLAKDDKRILFTGFLNGKEYEEICSNSYLYVETKTQGGVHPSLLEAMAFGNCVLAKKIDSHVEVLKPHGVYYQENLEMQLEKLLNQPDFVLKRGNINKAVIKKRFNWEIVIKSYEKNFF